MLAEIRSVPCGYEVFPVSERRRKRYAKHMQEVAGYTSHDGSVFLQGGDELDEFLDRHVPKAKHSHIRNGYRAHYRMDDWYYGHYLGWDAHNV